MALSAATVWEVRTTGSDNNGGGFKAGASGTDRSQQDAAQWSGTNLEIHGTTNTDVRPASGYTPGSTDVGNIVQIRAGTNFTTGFYEIVSIQSGYWRLDRAAGTAGSTGGTAAMGGALATIQKGLDVMTVADMLCWVKGGTYNISTALTTPSLSGANYAHRVYGYGSTRGDNPTPANGPIVKTNNNAINALNISTAAGWIFSYFHFDGSGSTKGLVGVNITDNYNTLSNCKISGFQNEGIICATPNALIMSCEVTGCGGSNAAVSISQGHVTIAFCYIHDNTKTGIKATASASVVGCIVASNSGASSDGLYIGTPGYPGQITNNVFYGNGRDGIRNSEVVYGLSIAKLVINNILVNNGGYGINSVALGAANLPALAHNAFYGNSSGAVAGFSLSSTDVTLTGSPFVDAANGNFAINSTSGQGGALRGLGYPQTFAGGTTSCYPDIGAAQHQDSGGGTTIIGGAWQ